MDKVEGIEAMDYPHVWQNVEVSSLGGFCRFCILKSVMLWANQGAFTKGAILTGGKA